MISYGSVCSGIEAASVAWECLGWRPAWFAQFDPEHNYKRGPDFPSAVLAYRWPDVTNLGDMTKIAAAIRAGHVEAPDVLVGGTPCQAFSIAGLRNGLSDSRGQLTLAFFELVNAIDEKRRENGKPPVIVVWENVPGVLNTKDNAFGCFLAGLAGESCELESPGKRWTNAGYVLGPERAVCWRVLDAQFFGVAQRRRRVFVVASARTDIDPAKILFESESLRWDIAPSRSAREIVAALTANGVGASGADDNQAQAGHLITAMRESGKGYWTEDTIAGTLRAEGENRPSRPSCVLAVRAFRMRAFGEYADDETASTVKARDHKDATDLAVYSSTGAGTWNKGPGTLRAREQESHEHLAVIAFQPGNLTRAAGAAPSTEVFPTLKSDNGRGISDQFPHVAAMAVHGTQDPDTLKEMAHTLGRNHGQENAVIAFSSKDSGHDAVSEISPTIRSCNSVNSNQNAGGPPAVAYAFKGGQGAKAGGIGYALEQSPTLTSANSGSNLSPTIMQKMAVRRLTPVECERLQGFPDNHTLIPRDKRKQITADEYAYLCHHFPNMTAEEAYRQAADGPRYKAIGNSMAVPVMRWIGRRIQEALCRTH